MEHHIWCNLRQGPAETCKQCVRLYELYPPIVGDTNGTELATKHFPNVTQFSRKIEEENLYD